MADDNFKIIVDGEDKEIRMTYGLLDAVCRACGDSEGALMIAIENELRDEALNILLAERDDQGRITEPLNIFTLDVSPEAISDLLEWAGAHALDFFLRAAERAKKTGDSRKDRLQALQST